VCVIWSVLVWALNRNTLCNFVSPAVNYCHYACGSTKVTVRSIHVMYRYSPSLPTIYNYHPPALIISIPPHNVIAVHHTQKTDTQTVPATVQLHYVLHWKVSWNTDFVSKCRIYKIRRYTYIYIYIYIYICFYGLLIFIAVCQVDNFFRADWWEKKFKKQRNFSIMDVKADQIFKENVKSQFAYQWRYTVTV